MDTYGTRNAIESLNQGRQYIAEQNALISESNVKRRETREAKKEEDSLVGDFNYAKDSISNLYQGSGIKDAYSSYQGRVKKNALKEAKAKNTVLAGNTEAEYGQEQVKKAYASQPKVVLSPEAQAQFDAQREQITATLPKPLPPIGSAVSSDDDEISRRLARLRGDDDPPLDLGGKSLEQAQADLEKQMGPERPPQIEATPTQIEATPDNDDAPTKLSTAPKGSAPEEPEPDLTTKLIKGATGVEDETAETLGRVGGAIAGASMGGISLYDDISSKVKTGKFFNPKDSGADDFSNVTNIIAGASDVVGLVPGLEWVAGLGNAVGGVGGIVKMFGDHAKNVATQQQDSVTNQSPLLSQTPDTTVGTIDETAQSNIRQGTTSASVY